MVFHCDRGITIKNIEETPEGFLSYVAPIARVGNLTYRNADGSTRQEYVSAEVLKASANSFKMKPNTLGHPPGGIVNASNAKQYQVGMTGHGVYFDNDFLWLTGTLTDATAIEAVKSGKAKEISCGYDAVVQKNEDGTYSQISRVGNHVAIVERGRAGAEVSFRFDSADETWVAELSEINDGGKSLKVKIDNKEFDIDNAELAVAVTALVGRYDSVLGEKTALATKLDALEGEKTALALRVDEAEKTKPSEEAIAETIKERLDCWSLVLPALRSDSADFNPDYKLSPAEIKTLFIKAKHPNINLEGKSDSYKEGLFEGLKPTPKTDSATSRTDALFDSLNGDAGDDVDGDDAIAKARKRRMKAIEDNSKQEAK